MYVSQPPIPLTLSISYDCDAELGRFTIVDSEEGDGFDEVRKSVWIRSQFDSPAWDPKEMKWRWEIHLVEMKTDG